MPPIPPIRALVADAIIIIGDIIEKKIVIRSIRGAIFCQVARRMQLSQDILAITEGSHQ